MSARLGSLAPLALIALALGACGGGGDDFKSDAEDICNDASERAVAAGASVAKQREILADSHAELAKLDPPSDKQADFDRLLKARAQIDATLGRVERARRKQDRAAAVSAQDRLKALQAEARRAAQAAGIPACGR